MTQTREAKAEYMLMKSWRLLTDAMQSAMVELKYLQYYGDRQ